MLLSMTAFSVEELPAITSRITGGTNGSFPVSSVLIRVNP